MAKHRLPIRIRAMREGIKSGRRLAIAGAVVVAVAGASAGMALASAASPAASAAITATTNVSNHPDTTSPTVANPGTACTSSAGGPVWALDTYTTTVTAVNSGSGTWNVTVQDKGSFAGFADPNSCNALKSKGSLLGLYHVTVTSANTPNPANLHSSYTTQSTTQMVQDFFGDPSAAVNGGDYFFIYQNGNYVQTTSSLYGDVIASH